jgi:hypothetical protein
VPPVVDAPPPLNAWEQATPLERFLVRGSPLPHPEALRRTRMGPLAYTRLDRGDPDRAQFREDYTLATARHLATKSIVLPLLRAWRDAGIEVLLFKGFYLAEFGYDHPAVRPYSDVDVLVRPDQWARAEGAARALGWEVLWSRRASLYRANHEEAILVKAGIVVEAHRFVIDCAAPWDAVQRRFTRAAWAASTAITLEDTAVRVLAPADAALMGVVLARTWSGGDDWHLKTADYLDLTVAWQRLGCTRAGLLDRAAQLRCSRSLGLFLRRCDPWNERLCLRPPTRAERRRWYLVAMPERGHLAVERAAVSLSRLPGTAFDVAWQAPRLLRLRRRLRGEAPSPEPSREPPPTTPRRDLDGPGGLRLKERIVRGIKWGARLLVPRGDPCRLRSFALYEALRATGAPVRLLEGRTRDRDDGRMHAWIELDGVSLRDLEDVPVCPVDDVVACYPSRRTEVPPRAVTEAVREREHA